MNEDPIKYGSRKFILTSILMVSSIPLVVFDIISQQIFQNIELYSLVIYITGNVAQKFGLESLSKSE